MNAKNQHIVAALTALALATAVRWRKVLPAIAVMGTLKLISGCAMDDKGKPSAMLGEKAQHALIDIFQKKDPDAVDRWFAEPFVQHDPMIADGLAGERAFARDVASSPNASITIYRTLIDGDLVLVHSKYEGLKDRPALIAFDLFRFKHGKIVEHWGGQEPLAPPNPAGRTQVDGPTTITDLDRTEANRALVQSFKQVVTVEQHFDRMGEFIDTMHYAQHASKVGDGAARLQTRINDVVQAGAGSAKPKTGPVLEPRRFIAEGNFVLAIVDANAVSGHTANYDLFRVENGKIAEHWDVLSLIPPPEQRKNSNDPF
ncbi:nuclear transport factor 2 family protein [Cupriavidus sp. 8B]